MKLRFVLSLIVCFLCALPSAARESAQIAASCLQTIKNRATAHGGPPVGSAEANEDYRECWEGSVQSRDGVAPDVRKICREELERRGRRLGTPQGDQEHRECVNREVSRTTPVLTAVKTCLEELRPRSAAFGGAEWDNAYAGCMKRSGVDRTTVAATPEPNPFGRGKVQAYLNALYHDDLNTLRAADAELRAMSIGGGAPHAQGSLLYAILNNYFIHYPIAFKDCLDGNAPKITIGNVYEHIKRRGGVEVSREIVDTRRDVPIARHLYPLARRVGASGGLSEFEEQILRWMGGSDMEEYRSTNVSHVVAKTMNELKCTDPVVKRLEQNFLKYAPVLMPARFANEQTSR